MSRPMLTLTAALALTAAAPLAQAQIDQRSTIVCESHDGQFNECRTPFGSAPVLVQKLSSTDCVEGRSWGSRWPGTVWVAQGCRGRFADARNAGGQGSAGVGLTRDDPNVVFAPPIASDRGYDGGRVLPEGRYGHNPGNNYVLRCESDGGSPRECRAPVQGRLVLQRQLSQTACIEGQTWGSGNGRVWVSGGCRGEFAPAGGYAVDSGARGGWGYGGYTTTCASEGNRYTQCQWDGRQGRPRLIEQLSQADCREGQSWGYTRGQLWVNNGCRARFATR
ncbi:MAG: DUF3011 domain-containing protein [Pseudomonadota bacterium]|nr:DUF3011 domain-containing protein [Pseudomonadota bacterium]